MNLVLLHSLFRVSDCRLTSHVRRRPRSPRWCSEAFSEHLIGRWPSSPGAGFAKIHGVHVATSQCWSDPLNPGGPRVCHVSESSMCPALHVPASHVLHVLHVLLCYCLLLTPSTDFVKCFAEMLPPTITHTISIKNGPTVSSGSTMTAAAESLTGPFRESSASSRDSSMIYQNNPNPSMTSRFSPSTTPHPTDSSSSSPLLLPPLHLSIALPWRLLFASIS